MLPIPVFEVTKVKFDPPFVPRTIPPNDTVGGLTERSALAEIPVPLTTTAVLEEYPVTLLVVPRLRFVLSGPVEAGEKLALNEID